MRWHLVLLGSLGLASAATIGAQPSDFRDEEVRAFCTSNDTRHPPWVTSIAPVRRPRFWREEDYQRVLGTAAEAKLRQLGLPVHGRPACFWDDPRESRSYVNNPDLDQLFRNIARPGVQVYTVDRLDTLGPPSPRVTSATPRATRPPVPAAAKPAEPAEPPTDQSRDVQALNQTILDRHAATEAEGRRRAAAHADAMRQHQAQVDAADQARRAHEAEIARNRAAREAYERELAAHQALVDRNRTRADREALVDWREAVTVCAFETNNPQSRFGNWTCHGPLQYTYAKLGDTGAAVTQGARHEIGLACGTNAAGVRDLGTASSYRVFGCGFGLHPDARQGLHRDQAARFGIAFISDRNIYRCPRHVSACRTR